MKDVELACCERLPQVAPDTGADRQVRDGAVAVHPDAPADANGWYPVRNGQVRGAVGLRRAGHYRDAMPPRDELRSDMMDVLADAAQNRVIVFGDDADVHGSSL